MKLTTAPLDLGAVTQDACDAVAAIAAGKRIDLVFSADGSSGELVEGDAVRVQQAIENLLVNAIKFTPEGGSVSVSVACTDDQMEVRVVDTGHGIDADFMPHVFERFRQGNSTSSRSHGGLGLGLAIVRRIVELHGGTVNATSQGEELGATFTIRLPILRVSTPAKPWPGGLDRRTRTRERRLGVATGSPQPERLDGLHILLVDDDADGRTLASLVLTDLGARVNAVASAREARQVLAGQRPDVLISDIAMPVEDGYALVRHIRQDEAENGGFLPAIALTGYAGDEEESRALAEGFQAHASKPLNPAKLTAAITRVAQDLPRRAVGADDGTIET
jgi:CheY-like chemotaxis protein/anti-sigma regulatory factor (Ser/Thr protein kinase)